MSISPPSDIVLDVARASDPQKYRAAVERLAQAAGAGAAETSAAASARPVEAFTVAPQAASQQAAATPATTAKGSAMPETAPASSASKTADDTKGAAAYQKFEAFLLQTFVESMLPKDASDVYGSGTAGDIWRSMFAEHIANELAASAKLGIAERISQHRKRS